MKKLIAVASLALVLGIYIAYSEGRSMPGMGMGMGMSSRGSHDRAPAAPGPHYLLIDGSSHYLIIDGASNKLRIDGTS